MSYITATKLYDFIQCPHKVWRDNHGPQEEKIIEANPFIELLWEKGVKHEEKIVSNIGDHLNLKDGPLEERFKKTMKAMNDKIPLIYQGVLIHENLLGSPDLLRRLPNDSYIPIDIKSGIGFEGADEEEGEEGKPKKHYAIQLCLYNDLLKRLGFASHDLGIIIDIKGDEVEYILTSSISVRNKETWWEFYTKTKIIVGMLLENHDKNMPAYGGKCKLCPWYNSCKKWCQETGDLTNIFFLGRSNRDKITEDLGIKHIDEFTKLDVEKVMELKEKEKKAGNVNFLYRIGKDSLSRSVSRAKILRLTKKPVLYSPIDFPNVNYELFFDIEDDPTQDYVYMHGVYERKGTLERFVHFTASEVSETNERKIWKNFWEYIDSLPQDNFAVYYYSPHEKTVYKRLQKKYPDVVSLEKVEAFFENPNVIDLYKIIQKYTDWPVSSYSIKSLATYLGFRWRDETPSGALSIQWFNHYLETKKEADLERIIKYNEDDCKATMTLKDALTKLTSGDYLK